MNKTELIAAMAEASGLSKKDCEAALAAFITTTAVSYTHLDVYKRQSLGRPSTTSAWPCIS